MRVATGYRRTMDSKTRVRAEGWLRYAQDLRLGPYYRDRAASHSAAIESPSAPEQVQVPKGNGSPGVGSVNSDRNPPGAPGVSTSELGGAALPIVQLPSGRSLFGEKMQNVSRAPLGED